MTSLYSNHFQRIPLSLRERVPERAGEGTLKGVFPFIRPSATFSPREKGGFQALPLITFILVNKQVFGFLGPASP